MANITKLTEEYISTHPSVKDSLRKGLINYSSLTRLIAKELNLDKSFDAILMACRRYHKKLKKEPGSEKDIINLLKNSKLEVKNRIVAFVLEKDIYFSSLIDIEKEVKKSSSVMHILEGATAITVITEEEFYNKIKKLFKNKILKETKDLAEVILRCPSTLETVPGVMAYLYSLFGERGINITETMSTWTDTLFVIEEKDVAKVMEMLRF